MTKKVIYEKLRNVAQFRYPDLTPEQALVTYLKSPEGAEFYELYKSAPADPKPIEQCGPPVAVTPAFRTIENLAKIRAKTEGITLPEAIAQIALSRPELYAEHRRQLDAKR